ncbi:porin [Vibrio maerlii]|uniref:porin n=1 Tax=Vibrio maerlii TaxID=2231648 RepID=UPI000E3BB21E|nr:porin [Vibrio maerlii]
MKKTLLALAVVTAATSAQAVEIFNQDGVTVGLHGDIEVVYKNETTRSSFQQEIQDADFGFDVRYMINDEFTAGAYWEFDGSEYSNADVTKNGDTYVALYSQSYGSIKFGRLCTALDDAGIGSDYQYGISSFFDTNMAMCGDEGVRYDIDTGMFYGTLGLIQQKVDSDGESIADNQDAYIDGKLGLRVADFDFTAFFGLGETAAPVAVGGNVDDSVYGLEARFGGIENLNLAAAYYVTDADFQNATGKDFNTDTIAFAADYYMDLWTFSAGYSIGSHDLAGKTENGQEYTEQDNWFVNAGYGIAPNTTVYAEVGGDDQSGSDLAFAIGAKAEF